MKNISDAANRLEGQKMFQILAKAQELESQGKKIIHFEIGDPDFDTPANIVDAACRALKKGDKFTLTGFGTFSVAKRRARTGRNPKTGGEIKIPATRVAKFKAGNLLKSAVK